MNSKNRPNKLVWLAGALLLVSFVFPNGFTLPKHTRPEPVVVTGETDAAVMKALQAATTADRAHVAGIYEALATVLARDLAKPPARITTTEQWADLQARTLQLAVATPGEYAGLDAAIEAVFAKAMATDDVLSVTPEVNQKLITACETIANSARARK